MTGCCYTDVKRLRDVDGSREDVCKINLLMMNLGELVLCPIKTCNLSDCYGTLVKHTVSCLGIVMG